MAIDSAKKRAAAFHWGRYSGIPSILPDGDLTTSDRYQAFWGYPPAGVGIVAFFATVLGSGVDGTTEFVGWYGDENGNFRVSNLLHEGP